MSEVKGYFASSSKIPWRFHSADVNEASYIGENAAHRLLSTSTAKLKIRSEILCLSKWLLRNARNAVCHLAVWTTNDTRLRSTIFWKLLFEKSMKRPIVLEWARLLLRRFVLVELRRCALHACSASLTLPVWFKTSQERSLTQEAITYELRTWSTDHLKYYTQMLARHLALHCLTGLLFVILTCAHWRAATRTQAGCVHGIKKQRKIACSQTWGSAHDWHVSERAFSNQWGLK